MKLSEEMHQEASFYEFDKVSISPSEFRKWANKVAQLEAEVELMEAVIFEHNELIEAAHYQIKRAIAQLERPESAGAVRAQLQAYLKGD